MLKRAQRPLSFRLIPDTFRSRALTSGRLTCGCTSAGWTLIGRYSILLVPWSWRARAAIPRELFWNEIARNLIAGLFERLPLRELRTRAEEVRA